MRTPSDTVRVAVDATSLLDIRTGVGTVTAALVDGLARRDDVELTAFPVSFRAHRSLRGVVPPGVRVRSGPVPATHVRRAWRRWDRPRLDTVIGRQDVVHGPNFVVPPSRAARIATVHDLTPVRYPELCSGDTLAYPELIARATAHGAWIHTPSDAVRHEVLDHFTVDPGRVVTVHNGFTPMAAGDPRHGRAAAGRDAYVLAVGTVEPRKDLPSLLRAIDHLASDGVEVPVVHVGPDGWGTAAFDHALDAMARPDLVTRLGRRSGQELADLYHGARVFAYPSVYEGFGMPLLEAMSAGVPVVSTSVPAVREVAGDAAVLVPVGDAEALAAAIAACWSDEAHRARLVAAGHARTARFSWEACVDGMVALYHRARDAGRP